MEEIIASPRSRSDSSVFASTQSFTFRHVAGRITIAAVALFMACAGEPVAPSIGIFAVNEKGLSKLDESGTAEAFQNGNARIKVRFFRFGSRGDWSELRGFLVNMPSVPADKLQVWRTNCDVYLDRDCVGEQKPISTKITQTSQDGVYLVRILSADGHPYTVRNEEPTEPLYIFIGAPAMYAPPQPVWGVALIAST